MKKLIALIFCLLSVNAFAASSVEGTLNKVNKFLSKTENYFQASLGFGMGKFSQGKKFDTKYSASQTTLEGGLTVGLPFKRFATTTMLGFSTINLGDDDLLKGQKKFTAGSEVDRHNAREFSIKQRLHYDFNIKSIVLRPFLDLGWGFGDYDYTVKNGTTKTDIEVDTGYTRFIVGLGAQAEYKNLLPFFKLELANLSYSGDAEVSTKTNGAVTNTASSTTTDLEDGNSFIISTGIGYKF